MEHPFRKIFGKRPVKTPFIPKDSTSAWAQYSLLADNRDEIQQQLRSSGIPTVVYYPKPLHLQTAFRHLEYSEGDFPISESVSKKIFSLPMNPYLQEKQIEQIVEVFRNL